MLYNLYSNKKADILKALSISGIWHGISRIFHEVASVEIVLLAVLEIVHFYVSETPNHSLDCRTESARLIRLNLTNCEYEAGGKLFPEIVDDVALPKEQANTIYCISVALTGTAVMFKILESAAHFYIKKISDARNSDHRSCSDLKIRDPIYKCPNTTYNEQQYEHLKIKPQDKPSIIIESPEVDFSCNRPIAAI